jgi:hypothetical protein
VNETIGLYQPTTTITVTSCAYCGTVHNTICHRIQEIEYHPNGSIKRVVLRP